jgi:glutathione-regulated potassium-efflux system ancillary protein KefC
VLALVVGLALVVQVGIKGDLGALIIGMLLAPHPAANGLSKAMFNLKELFLVGFFVSIGLTALPTWEMIALAVILVVLVPLKSILYLLIFSGFRLRHRTTLLATLSMTNFSEFGLIVAVLAASQGWMTDEWLVVLSLTVALSFVASAILNTNSSLLYQRAQRRLPDPDPARLHPNDQPIELGDARAVVLGMGRVGRGAYDRLANHYGYSVLGVENDADKVADLQRDGYTVVEGDASDADFWEKLLLADTVELVLLAMPHHAGNIMALEELHNRAFRGRIAAVVQYTDEIEPLRRRGADAVFHVYEEAGQALADSAVVATGSSPPDPLDPN